MPLLLPSRRYMGALVVGIVGLLLLSNLIPDPSGRFIWRGGQKAPDAPWYHQAHGALQRLGFYLQDNFGFRASLPLLRGEIRDWAGAPETGPVYEGRNGQLFWAGQEAPAQSAGALFRTEAVERFAALMTALKRELAPQGAELVVALPPNAQSVDVGELPEWQDRLPQRRTEYSYILDELKTRGIVAVDLRDVLKASPDPRKYLVNDSHWNNRSTVLAFNATMRAAGHPDWQVSEAELVGPMQPYPLGDLARSLRRAPPHPDENQALHLKAVGTRSDQAFETNHESRLFNGFSIRYAETGPRVLIIGDSYTVRSWPYLFAFTPVAEAGWMHFSQTTFGACDFDFAQARKFKPDLLIVARAERMFPCLENAWPFNLPAPD
ncbi:alginate O-acetyltransferase AlgX-related protein [Aquabacter spiritensis]|uniref:Acetyltransferase AlgX (SGNH hydrolase-like protein) n=1 Tax=Aquabacter spiritensis TaxID=933073 RepID=A0A4R3LQM2_9HYPH|nr:hypothetical protein [Aquabacter spiritensis]TCT02854.1 acetyltransferase AlgX (SGNH hydrolase-like protein) [Aquabacter spiritensis]